MRRELYPDNWEAISRRIRYERAGGRCEWVDESGHRCECVNGQPNPRTGSRVVLTVAHLGAPRPDGTPGDKHDRMDCRPENLAALCQEHHLRLDHADHIRNSRETRRRRLREAGQMTMFEEVSRG